MKRVSISSRLLLHCCCGPCATVSIDVFRQMGYEVVTLFFNPNIAPADEYNKRLSAWKTVCEDKGVHGIIREDDEYKPQKDRDRCAHCYQTRLRIASKVAIDINANHFTTTLTISPYQNHALIRAIGDSMRGFRYFDLRDRYRDSLIQSRSLNLYLQRYCGCLESQLEAQWMMKNRREKRRKTYGDCVPWKPDCVLDRDNNRY